MSWHSRVQQRACREAEHTAKIPHDFKRAAVRSTVRVGIPERVLSVVEDSVQRGRGVSANSPFSMVNTDLLVLRLYERDGGALSALSTPWCSRREYEEPDYKSRRGDEP
jgi:hypothetical protein